MKLVFITLATCTCTCVCASATNYINIVLDIQTVSVIILPTRVAFWESSDEVFGSLS